MAQFGCEVIYSLAAPPPAAANSVRCSFTSTSYTRPAPTLAHCCLLGRSRVGRRLKSMPSLALSLALFLALALSVCRFAARFAAGSIRRCY